MVVILDSFANALVERLVSLAENRISVILGVKHELRALKKKVEFLATLLSDAESRKISEDSIRAWVTDLREILYDADDVLEDCRVEGQNLLSSQSSCTQCLNLPIFSCFHDVALRNDIGNRIRSINSHLVEILERTNALHLAKSQSSTAARPVMSNAPLMADEDIIGIDDDATTLVNLITSGKKSQTKCPIFAITGMPGIGKTTLAHKITNDLRIRSHFQIPPIFLSVSKEYNPVDLLNEMGRCIMRNEGKEHKEAKSVHEASTVVRDLVEGKALLVVLDDVWEAQAWEHLSSPLSAGKGTRVLLTSRNTNVAKEIRAFVHPARKLTHEQAWLMLRRQVFGDDEGVAEFDSLKGIGMEIVEKCKGLPLAIKTIAGMLKTRDRSRVRDWEVVRDSATWNLNNLGNDIKPGLLLSYEDLRPDLKQCFLYSSLFPEDYRFHQKTLVQMWIAEGLVVRDGDRALEEIGEDRYNELIMRNMLQAAPEYYQGKGCTMHDLLRAVAHYVSGSGGVGVKCRHFFHVNKESDKFPYVTHGESLRTLLLSKNPKIRKIPNGYFDRLRHLRALDLAHTGIRSLPDTLGSLLHLRFLNVAFTKIEKIPESIGKLKNLETLKANDLKYLEELPEGIAQLGNLRHLEIGSAQKQLNGMPVGIRYLKKLRTITGFVVNDGGGECNMRDLGELDEVAHVSIFMLERVSRREDAEAARLVKKEKMSFLRLSCARIEKGKEHGEAEKDRIGEVFEGLKPHKKLEALSINGYFGVRLPTYLQGWYLENLNWLRLDGCKFIEQLPPLGQLPKLTALHIWGALTVKEIKREFFSAGPPGGVGFPQLQECYLKGMPNLKNIEGVERGALPLLKKLQVIRCPKLTSLPDGLDSARKLTHLLVEDAERIETIKNLDSVVELKLAGNSKLKEISGLQKLDLLTISNCPELKDVNCPDQLSFVSMLSETMQALPEWLARIRSLKSLDIKGNLALLEKCVEDGVEWPKIAHVQHLQARTFDGSRYISYQKNSGNFQSNLNEDDPVDQPSTSNVHASDDDEEGTTMPLESFYDP